LAAERPDVYNSCVAATLYYLGSLHRDVNSYSQAESELKESLEIRRALKEETPETSETPDVFRSRVASSLVGLGLLHTKTGDYLTAEAELSESLATRRELATSRPDVYGSSFAASLNYMGELHMATGDYPAAERELKKSLELFRALAEERPLVYRSCIAEVLNNLGKLDIKTGSYSAAESELTESLSIFCELAKRNRAAYCYCFRAPDKENDDFYNYCAYIPYVATTLNNLGELHIKTESYSVAELELKECLLLFQSLSEETLSVCRSDVAQTRYHLALLYRQTGLLYMAHKEAQEYIELFASLPEPIQRSEKDKLERAREIVAETRD
ncbi:MAG: tetratricopeptide repeat protein, partial [Thermoguttaceae bacterium]|nr:tetratricopeptide repeat protein [Thermoguttaceae bacterium]